MHFDSRRDGDSLTLRLVGRLEFTDHERLHQMAAEIAADPLPRLLVIDASQLEFIDSAGLGMLLILRDRAEERGRQLVVRGAKGEVRRSIQLSRIDDLVTLEP